MNYKGKKKLALIFMALMLVTACGKTDSKVDDKNTDIAVEEENATDKEFIAYKELLSGKLQGSNEKVNSTLPMKNGLFCDFEE